MSGNIKSDRVDALRDLIEVRIPIDQAAAALLRFGWDSEEELVILRRYDVLRMLERYERRELTEGEWQRWAEALEGRDDIGLEVSYEEDLKEFLFETSSPEICEPLTPDLSARWKRKLAVAPPD